MSFHSKNYKDKVDLGVLFECEHDFRRSVPPGSNVFSHKTSLRSRWFSSFDRPRETEIADFEITIGVQKQVRGFKITMDNIGRVQRLERPKCLIYEVLSMVVGQILCSNDTVHISFHQLLDNYRNMQSYEERTKRIDAYDKLL